MKHPNIIIINPDEMRWDSMGHMGNPAAKTPFLDSFADSEAVSFRYAYCQNPVCVPSRCSFFTGLYPHVRGHRTMQYLLHEGEPTLFSELKDAGYYVWMNARNDLVAGQIPGLAERHASEVYYYDRSAPISRANLPGFGGAHHTEKEDYPYSHFKGLGQQQKDQDWEDTYAACERIRHPAEPDKPLCLFLGWNNPHPPYMAEEPFFSSIDRDKLLPRIKYDETAGKSLMLKRLRDHAGMADYPEERWTELRAVYLAQCAKVDEMFQTVCRALKEADMYDDSAIFFLSDHGDFCGDYDLPEKAQNTFEDCLTRVPLLVKPPKGCALDPGISDSLAELVDFYATVMDYAGVEPDHDHFGRSLRPVIADRAETVRSFVCCEGGRLAHELQCDEWHVSGENGPSVTDAYWPKKTAQKDADAHEKGTMIFDGRYKYVHRPSGQDELYDMSSEQGERVNLFPNLDHQHRVQQLRELLLDWYQQTCDVVPRSYDSRFTAERIWASVRAICPPEKEAAVREYISAQHPTIMQAMLYVFRLSSAGNMPANR